MEVCVAAPGLLVHVGWAVSESVTPASVQDTQTQLQCAHLCHSRCHCSAFTVHQTSGTTVRCVLYHTRAINTTHLVPHPGTNTHLREALHL